MTKWKIMLYGLHIDTVFYDNTMSEVEVLLSLINHNGYDAMITLMRAK